MVCLRIKYEKRGPIWFTSHRDLLRIFRRCIAAGGIPVRFTQGINPHSKFSFGPSLRTGWESLDEYMDIFLETHVDDPAPRFNAYLPDGLRVMETAPVSESVPKLSADVKAARYGVVLDAAVRPEVKTFFEERVSDGNGAGGNQPLANGLESALRRRFNLEGTDKGLRAESQVAPLPVVQDVSVWEDAERREPVDPGLHIEYTSTMDGGKNVSPEELVTPVLGDVARLSIPMRVTRTGLFVKRRGDYFSPIDSAVVEKQL